MRRLAAIALGVCIATRLWTPTPLGAADDVVRLIVHPSRASAISEAEARAIYLKQKLFWSDGKPIVAINREAGSTARETFSQRLFGQSSTRQATYWNQRYFEAGEFPPATLASEEAVTLFVSANQDAVGYVAGDVGDSVAVVLVLR